MLDFFRRYQRYFFFVITVVIIISFSFFGTYSTLGSNTWREQIAFKAVDGSEITRSDVDEMAIFLATDNEDKRLYGGVWGPNFLNDGVIRKDFLQTGMAEELAAAYINDLSDDLNRRFEREKKYTPYTHPQARFLNAVNTWNYFIPEMTTYLDELKNAQTGQEILAAKIKLFLTEKRFPSSTLKQVLRYQEKQYNWIAPDSDLDRIDLSLFGYHTLEDWFGPHFSRLVSEFIINAALLAEQKGYSVSKSEALADLIRNTEISYQQNQNNPNLGVRNPEEYLNEQLQRMNMDQAKAIKIWRQVLLFRRYFQDTGNSALVDTLAYQKFNDFTKETVELDIYRLPPSLHLSTYPALQKLEVYLQAVAKPSKDPLALPKSFLPPSEVAKNYPELVQKRYLLRVSQINKKALQAKVGIKEMWNWQVQDDNWNALVKQFPELGTKASKTQEERLAVLDNLDSTTRIRVDSFARSSIVDQHPEWIRKALDEASSQKMVIGLRTEGGKAPLTGLDNKDKRAELMQLLDKAPLDTPPSNDSKLAQFSGDKQNYYRITVLEKGGQPEILTFAEAQSDGTLDQLSDHLLEKYYTTIRDQNPSLYQNSNGSWKDFKEIRDLVAERYFEKTLNDIQKGLAQKEANKLPKDTLASLRFYAYLRDAQSQLQANSSAADQWVKTKKVEESADRLSARKPLEEQWLLEKTTRTLSRKAKEEGVDTNEAFMLGIAEWSSLKTPANGDLVFYQVLGRDVGPDKEVAVAKQTEQAHQLLSAESQRILMKQVLEQIKAKQAISLSYLNRSSSEESSEDGME